MLAQARRSWGVGELLHSSSEGSLLALTDLHEPCFARALPGW